MNAKTRSRILILFSAPLVLVGCSKGKSVQSLIADLKNPDAKVRRAAAQSLGAMGPKAQDAVPALTEALQDLDKNVRSPAAAALGKLRPEATDAVSPLIQALKD
jgi:HEAT repeat protein